MLSAGFVQHPMDPCVFLLFEPVTAEMQVQGQRFRIPRPAQSDDGVGEPGSLCGVLGVHVDDQVNGGRGQRWKKAIAALRLRFRFRKWVTGSGEFTGSWLEQRSDLLIAQVQTTPPLSPSPRTLKQLPNQF